MSKKKVQSNEIQARKRRNQLLTIAIALLIGVIALIAAYLVFFTPAAGAITWKLDSSDRLTFDSRPAITANSTSVESNANYALEKVAYKSFGEDVYALLRVPKGTSRPPVVIVLPAASINKTADSTMANALCSWGYATLTLDERGNNGETPGPSPMDLDSGYHAFTTGGDPVQYKQIYDVLLGYDYLRTRQDLDYDNIIVLGESMGGRFAIIAAAEEPRLKAAFVVSSGPYGIKGGDVSSSKFIDSIEPASYLSLLPPRKLVMFHFTNDSVIPVSLSRQLYDAAEQPKVWHEYNGNVHGVYNEIYAPDLHSELRSVFGK